MLYTALSIRAGRSDIIMHHLISYVDCMAGGNRRDHDCQSLKLDIESETFPVIDAILIISTGFLNFSTLSFVIQFKTIKNIVGKAVRKFKITLSTSTTTTTTTITATTTTTTTTT